MTLPEVNEAHHKHPKITKPALGEFGRNELALIGAPCSIIRSLSHQLIGHLPAKHKITYVDADHTIAGSENGGHTQASTLDSGASTEFTDKIGFRRLDYSGHFNSFQKRVLLNDQDLVLVNGNHFNAQCQVVIIHPDKPLARKLDRLTDVRLILLSERNLTVPDYLRPHLPDVETIPVLYLEEVQQIAGLIAGFLKERIPRLNGLVLAGGQSTRMQTDKGSLAYHGSSQRLYMYNMLKKHCQNAFISSSPNQTQHLAEGLPLIEDRFAGLGPLNGILSALQQEPDAAWLVTACDLPYLSASTIQYLVEHRNPAKTATAFLDPEGRFPEPLITIWEPRSYLIMLQMLSQGFNCPRKVLINTDAEILQAPDLHELQNVNHPGEYRKAMEELQNKA